MPSAAAAANRPMPRPAPITTMPRPIAAPKNARAMLPPPAASAAAPWANTGVPTIDATARASAPATTALTRALLIPVSFRKKSFSVMGVNVHADEHGRQESKDVRLDEHHDHFEHRNAHRKRHGHREPHAVAGNGASEQVRKDEDERQTR